MPRIGQSALLVVLLLAASLQASAQELTEARRIAVAERLSQSTVTVASRGRGVGSGFVVGRERFIVTNAHVVRGVRRGAISVHFPDGQVLPAEVLAVDARKDLAILSVDEAPAPPITVANSDRVRVGQSVLAYGSPHGLSGTLTQGIVSARRDNLRGVGNGRIRGLIQTDAPINPGNSGGPLVDSRGRVIGVNTLIISRTGGSEGIGFAVPSNLVRELVGALRERRARIARRASRGARAIGMTRASSGARPKSRPNPRCRCRSGSGSKARSSMASACVACGSSASFREDPRRPRA